MARPVVLVVDTGVDDALALLVAVRHPAVEVQAVVATAGNVGLDRVAANTAHVLDLLGADVPLLAGAARRRDGRSFPVRAVHGPDGLAGCGPPTATARELPPAAGFRLPGDALVVSLGPATAVLDLPAGEVLAACCRPGEANHAMDPAAGDELSHRASLGLLRLRHHGGPAFAAPRLGAATAARLAGSTDPVTALAGRLLAHQAVRGAGIGDAGTVLSVAEPGLPPATAAARLVALAGTRVRSAVDPSMITKDPRSAPRSDHPP